MNQSAAETLPDRIVAALRTIHDPEIPVNIYDLGLIYGIELDPGGKVRITMTLTSPACPVARSLPSEVGQKVSALAGVAEATVRVVWDPPWDPEKMSEAARLQLGLL